MSANVPSIFRDSSGNIREVANTTRPLAIGGSGFIASTLVAAGAAQVTLTAASGYHWVIDKATVCLSSVAANTSVPVTITDGTNTLAQFAFSAAGKYELVAPDLDKISIAGASGKLVAMTSGSAGAASTTTLVLSGHKVLAADV
jgi:hypothetical protein